MSRNRPPEGPETGQIAKSPNDHARMIWMKQLLGRTPIIRNACDLDLVVFLHRHPRTMLTTEQLASFVGYDLKEIARSLDTFIEAGALERTVQQSLHAARMFVLRPDGPQTDGMRTLLELASTREGRKTVLEVLKVRDAARPELRLIQSAQRAAG